MELFPITFPKQNICEDTALYFRMSRGCTYHEQVGYVAMGKKATLTLDTYFNCFSYRKYFQYTKAHILDANVIVEGHVEITLMLAQKVGRKVRRSQVAAITVDHDYPAPALLSYDYSYLDQQLKEEGPAFLYLQLTCLDGEAKFCGGSYDTPLAEEALSPTKVAAVICTYKREDYVKRNLDTLNRTFFPHRNMADLLEVFVVDNGKTLAQDDVVTGNIRLFPNKNYGGSGGFTRGMIEALNRKEEFSHVLLMDDDILLESNVLVKTVRFLQLLKEEHKNLSIGGSMLRLEEPWVQHEAGANWTGMRIQHGNHNLDVRDIEVLFTNEDIPQMHYNAWWYCCMPVKLLRENGLPFPFFIKVDDIEYGMRVMQNLLIMNGIGIWHMSFQNKEKSYLHFYDTRNKLVTNAVHYPENGLFKSLFITAHYIGKILLSDHYETYYFPIDGYHEFMKGTKRLMTIDHERKNTELIQKFKQLETKPKSFAGRAKCFVLAGVAFVGCIFEGLIKFKKVKKDYQDNWKEVTSEEHWKSILELE